MSSTRGGAATDPTNLFVTPGWAVDAVLPHLPLSGSIVDPGCGEGAILARVVARLTTPGSVSFPASIRGVELDPERAARAHERIGSMVCGGKVVAADWMTWGDNIPGGPRVNLAIFNPPFVLAQAFIERALHLTARFNGTVAALLRANWSIPACRADFAKAHPFDLAVLRKRCDFVASLKCGETPRCGWKRMQPIEALRPKACPGCNGKIIIVTTDSSDYGWHIWGPGRGGRFFALDIPETPAPPEAPFISAEAEPDVDFPRHPLIEQDAATDQAISSAIGATDA